MTDDDPGLGPERRRAPRAAADWAITVELDSGPCEARVRDISRSGLSFFVDRPIRVMTCLRLAIDLPVRHGGRRVYGTGAVVRCEKISARIDHYEVAVFLQEMAEPDRALVAEYVDAWRAACAG
jgi:hypothetical protein